MRFRRITEYKKYAGKHPDLNSCETLRLRGVGVYVVEDVDSVQVDDIIIPVESVEDGVEISVACNSRLWNIV